MATNFIKLKRSAVPGKRPSTTQIELGELALNTNDGRLFTRKEAVGIGTTVTLLNVWTENPDSSSVYYNDGNVGIGTTNPTSILHVQGDVLVSGVLTSTDYNSTSDLKLKENIQSIKNPIDKVLSITGVSFNWKETGKCSIGVIAQDIEKVLPELVNGEKTKTVNYNGLIGLLIEVVKEQQKEINILKEKLQ